MANKHSLPCGHVHNSRWSKCGLVLSCCCNPTDLQGLLWGFVFSWDFVLVSHIGLGTEYLFFLLYCLFTEPSQKLHMLLVLIFSLFLTSLAAHLYFPTIACIWLSLSVGTVLMFYFWFHLLFLLSSVLFLISSVFIQMSTRFSSWATSTDS